MLVLSRFRDEKIVINGNIVITIVEVRHGGKVRIGIDAPENIPIHRLEVQEAIERERLNDPDADRRGSQRAS